jgi:hypothetical protein
VFFLQPVLFERGTLRLFPYVMESRRECEFKIPLLALARTVGAVPARTESPESPWQKEPPRLHQPTQQLQVRRMKVGFAERLQRGAWRRSAAWAQLSRSPEAARVRSKRRRRSLRAWSRFAFVLLVTTFLGLATLWYVAASGVDSRITERDAAGSSTDCADSGSIVCVGRDSTTRLFN